MSHSCDASTSAESSQARHWLEVRTITFLTLRCCSISWNICTNSSRCLVTLVCFVTSSVPTAEGTYPPAVGYALFFMGPWVPTLAVLSWFLGSQSLAVLLSPMISMPTSPSESQLSIHPRTSSVLTSRASRTHRPLVTIEVAIFHEQQECLLLCQCTKSAAPSQC